MKLLNELFARMFSKYGLCSLAIKAGGAVLAAGLSDSRALFFVIPLICGADNLVGWFEGRSE